MISSKVSLTTMFKTLLFMKKFKRLAMRKQWEQVTQEKLSLSKKRKPKWEIYKTYNLINKPNLNLKQPQTKLNLLLKIYRINSKLTNWKINFNKMINNKRNRKLKQNNSQSRKINLPKLLHNKKIHKNQSKN